MINIYDIVGSCGASVVKDILFATDDMTVERVILNGYLALSPDFRRVKAAQWLFIVAGALTLTRGGETSTLKAGESVFIKSREKFRIDSTCGAPPCVVVIVYGSSAKED